LENLIILISHLELLSVRQDLLNKADKTLEYQLFVFNFIVM